MSLIKSLILFTLVITIGYSQVTQEYDIHEARYEYLESMYKVGTQDTGWGTTSWNDYCDNVVGITYEATETMRTPSETLAYSKADCVNYAILARSTIRGEFIGYVLMFDGEPTGHAIAVFRIGEDYYVSSSNGWLEIDAKYGFYDKYKEYENFYLTF